MKHFKALVFVNLIFVDGISYTQTYIPFPEDNAQWCFSLNTGHPPDTGPYTYYKSYFYTYESDTLINGKNYKNLSKTLTFSSTCCNEWGAFDVNNIDEYVGKIGALRVEDMKVYFYAYTNIDYDNYSLNIPDTTEVLLYDFDVELGDTLSVGSYPGSYLIDDPYIVIGVDSILCDDGIYHKEVIVNNTYYSGFWVEGIGDAYNGLFGPFINEFEGSEWMLKVFSQDSFIVFSVGLEDCFIGGINSVQSLTDDVQISYISNEYLKIHLPAYLYSDYYVIIHDIHGQEMLSEVLKLSETILYIKGLKNGIYVVSVFSNSRVVKSQKFIISQL